MKRGVAKHNFGPSDNWLFLVLIAGCCSLAEPNSTWKSSTICPTGDIQRVVIDTSTGEWKLLDDPIDVNVDTTNTIVINDNNDDNNDDNNGNNKGLLSDTNTRRLLRNDSFERILPVDPLQITNNFHRLMSTDGSNSLVTSESGNGNVKDNTMVMALARTCDCHENDVFVALCPEHSGWCTIDATEASAKCYSTGRMDWIARNIWPLLWLWYCTICAAVCCTFQGRILLDYVRGTILYYFCGFGDRFRNRDARNVDRYNNWIVEEIMDDERVDRQNVRRRRNEGSVTSRQMDAVANRSIYRGDGENDRQATEVPPTIVTSPSFLAGGSLDDTDSDDEAVPSPNLMRRLIQRCRNVVWPCQTSWKRYIKYNLMMRVEWIAMQDEFAFIESRQQRGLPHARFEMKTRRWNAATDVCSCSIEPSSLINSVDEPHCTICFSELEDGDKIGDLGCRHVFHADCLKMWVTKRNACPLCNIPIAHRKRILSDEFVKEEIESREPLGRSGLPSNNTGNSTDYDQTRTSVEGHYGSPSNQQRRGPRRLSQMPMTPSTVAASNYSSEDEFEDLEASSSPQNQQLESFSPAAVTSDNSSMFATPTHAEQIQEAEDESETYCSENINALEANTGAALDDVGCNINDFLEREESETDGIDIPSPPRRIRRRADENENKNDGDGNPMGDDAFAYASSVYSCFECGSTGLPDFGNTSDAVSLSLQIQQQDEHDRQTTEPQETATSNDRSATATELPFPRENTCEEYTPEYDGQNEA